MKVANAASSAMVSPGTYPMLPALRSATDQNPSATEPSSLAVA